MFGKRNEKPFHDAGRSPEAATYLAAQLELLMALPLTSPIDVECWNQECDSVQQILEEQFPRFEPFPEIWHFFSDADIRCRDSGYKDHQHRLMSEYIHNLRNETSNT
jgi:hypothetical protein